MQKKTIKLGIASAALTVAMLSSSAMASTGVFGAGSFGPGFIPTTTTPTTPTTTPPTVTATSSHSSMIISPLYSRASATLKTDIIASQLYSYRYDDYSAEDVGDTNWWVNIGHKYVDNSNAWTISDGSIGTYGFGVDRLIADNIRIGASISYDHAEVDTTFNLGTYETEGYSIEPYLSYRLNKNWSIDLIGGYTDYDIDVTKSNGALYGDTDGSRLTGLAQINFNTIRGPFRFGANVGCLTVLDNSDALRYNDGSTFEDRDYDTGQMRVGVSAEYTEFLLRPFASVRYEQDNVKTERYMGNEVDDDNGFATALGVRLDPQVGFSGGVTIQNDVGRSDVDDWGATAFLNLQF